VRARRLGPGGARVDHIKSVRTHPQLALSLANLRTLCPAQDNQGHQEKRLRSAAGREEKFVITGCDANGMPLDPAHRWRS
jgi:5-methylcytosine-specific restriction endonuclease McrA